MGNEFPPFPRTLPINLTAGEKSQAQADLGIVADLTPTMFQGDTVGVVDNTAAVISVLFASGADAKKRKRIHGVNRITSTIGYPASTAGGVVSGDGIQPYYHLGAHAAQPGSHTVLVWDGVAGGTMFNGDNQLRVNFDNMTAVGRVLPGNSNRAGFFWKGVYPVGGASGVHTFQDFSWEDFDTVFKFGEGGSVGAADVTWRKCEALNINTFLETTNNNCVNFNFDQFSANEIRRIAALKPGGNLLVRMLNAATCGGTGEDDWMFDLSLASGALIFSNIRLEQNSPHFLRAVACAPINITGLQEAQGNIAQTLVSLDSGTCYVSDSELSAHDATNPTFILNSTQGGIDGALILDRVHFNAETFILSEWVQWADANARTQLIIRNCTYGAAATRLPYYNNRLEGGKVRLFCRTTTNGQHWISADGADSGNFHNCVRIPSDSIWSLDVKISARTSDGSAFATFHRRATVNNVGGTISISAVQTVGTDVNASSFPVPVITDYSPVSAVLVRATGLSSTAIDWVAEVEGVGALSALS